jgi:NitT/TauT family transport system ATP-binding protein
MKHSREFLDMKKEILERIRETSGMKTDSGLLAQMSRSVGHDGA